MNKQQYLATGSSAEKSKPEPLSGLWLRWNSLMLAEQVICVGLVMAPLWWLIGWNYVFLWIFAGLGIYEVLRHGRLQLKKPSLSAITAIVFGLYTIGSVSLNSQGLSPSIILSPFILWICGGLLIWYIQSNNLRVRLEVIAWALTVLAIEMIVFWLFVHFVLKEPHYNPPLSVLGLLTSKSERYIPGVGNSNYLMPYFPDDKIIAGLNRFVFFFPGPEALALIVGFMGLLALDIKNRLWSLSLFLCSVFLLLLSGTRSAWIAFLVVVAIRSLFVFGKSFGAASLCTLFAVASFTTLSLPSATNWIVSELTNTAEATGNLRGDSTAVRSKIYQRTLEAVVNEPDNLMFGRGVTGKTVLPEYKPAMVGSHSFILGTLIYRRGLLGTGIFLIYWLSLIFWLYHTRTTRPLSCLLVLLFFSITFATMELELPIMPVTLICLLLQKPNVKFSRKMNA